MKKLIPPSRYKITIKQQPKGIRMIVENHDMSDCLAIYGYKLRPDGEASLLSSRCGIRQPVGSNHHHSFLKRSKTDISQDVKLLLGYFECSPRNPDQRVGVKDPARNNLVIANP
jgi:hypothetical protein